MYNTIFNSYYLIQENIIQAGSYVQKIGNFCLSRY